VGKVNCVVSGYKKILDGLNSGGCKSIRILRDLQVFRGVKHTHMHI